MTIRVFQVWNEQDKLSNGETPTVLVFGQSATDADMRTAISEVCFLAEDNIPDWSTLVEHLKKEGFHYEKTEHEA